MGIICTKHDKEMTLVKTDGLAKNWIATYRCPEGHNVTLKESDWEANKEILLAEYKKVWDKVNKISKRTDAIIQSSGVGQAPPIFHQLVDKQLEIIEKEATPIWDKLKHFIRSDFKTYWQYTRWTIGSLVPSYSELGESA